MVTSRRYRPTVRAVVDAGVRTLALFALANLLLGLFSKSWNANWLWIQGGAVPKPVVTALVLLFSLGVIFGRQRSAAIAFATRFVVLLLGITCLADTIIFYRLLSTGRLHSTFPLPLSLGLALLLLAWVALDRRAFFPTRSRTRRALWIRVMGHAAPLVLALVGVLAHILSFGASDYRRPADAVVVFGAAVRASGEASPALWDRTVTACRLYHQGLAPTLVLSGGRDPAAPLSEPECMALIARAHGVPAEALILDETGANSKGSIRLARALASSRGWSRVLMVSHDYHLARIKLLSQRAGLDALTVPAEESVAWPSKPLFVGREVIAWAYWYVRC